MASAGREWTHKNIRDEIADLTRGLLSAQAEAIASMADAARDVLDKLSDHESLRDSIIEGDAIRQLPDAVCLASMEASRGLIGLPGRVVDCFYREYHRGRGQGWTKRADTPQARREPSAQDPAVPEQDILGAARQYLDRVPGRTATLRSVAEHAALATNRDRELVRTIIGRHFVASVSLVRDAEPRRSALLSCRTAQRMHDTLINLGYTDLRYDVPVKAFDDFELVAQLVAYVGSRPIVLCYPVESGANDPLVREAARVQALALGRASTGMFVWVGDGEADYFLDLEKDTALASLPPNSRTGKTARSSEEPPG